VLHPTRIAFICLLVAAACGTSPTYPDGTGVFLVEEELVDTVVILIPVHFVVVNDGRPVSHATITLTTDPTPPYIIFGGSSDFTSSAQLFTDSEGKASYFILTGPVSGIAHFTAEYAGTETQFAVTISPGAAVRHVVAPRDTSMYVGANLTFVAHELDRFDNIRPDTFTFTSLRPEVADVSNEGVMSGKSLGRAAIAYSSGTFEDTVRVSVVPEGRVVFASADFGPGLSVHAIDLDGGNVDLIAPDLKTWARPAWYTDGQSVVYGARYYEPGYFGALMIEEPSGPRVLAARPELFYPSDPRVTTSGDWIYFSARFLQSATVYESSLYRVTPDGIDFERLTFDDVQADIAPDPSPDGSMLAYGSVNGIRVMDVATRALTDLGIDGTHPRWSPSGERIAFVLLGGPDDGRLAHAKPDGTDLRLVPTERRYNPTIDWSPDGRYLIAADGIPGPLHLIDVETGETLPISYAVGWNPAWRR